MDTTDDLMRCIEELANSLSKLQASVNDAVDGLESIMGQIEREDVTRADALADPISLVLQALKGWK